MKKITIEVYAKTRYVGSEVRDKIDFYIDELATDAEIETAKEDAAREWMYEQVDWGFNEI
jgi:hypothetical protein